MSEPDEKYDPFGMLLFERETRESMAIEREQEVSNFVESTPNHTSFEKQELAKAIFAAIKINDEYFFKKYQAGENVEESGDKASDILKNIITTFLEWGEASFKLRYEAFLRNDENIALHGVIGRAVKEFKQELGLEERLTRRRHVRARHFDPESSGRGHR